MKKFILFLFCLKLTLLYPDNIVIQNRVLAKVNSNTLSIMDIAKKMDMVFVREFPLYADSVEARMQFYNTNWKAFLYDMLDEQLILASAKELKVAVTDGEVRQEIEETLGPNVIARIDQMNLSYEDVFKMVQNELIVRRMIFAMVHAKAVSQVSPQKIKEAYEKYCQEHPAEESWNYQVITIRSDKRLAAIAASQLILKALEQNAQASPQENLDRVSHFLSDVQASCSEEFHRTAKTLSSVHQTALQGLKKGEHSEAIEAKAQRSNECLYRIFILNDYSPAGSVSFSSLEEKLQSELINQTTMVLSDEWRQKLRARYGFDRDYLAALVPEGYQPFSLQR